MEHELVATIAANPDDVVAEPGAEIDVAVEMTAVGAGLQRSTWQLMNAQYDNFGDEIFVEVVVRAA